MHQTLSKEAFICDRNRVIYHGNRLLPGCSVHAIGEPGLLHALYESGITMNDISSDSVDLSRSPYRPLHVGAGVATLLATPQPSP